MRTFTCAIALIALGMVMGCAGLDQVDDAKGGIENYDFIVAGMSDQDEEPIGIEIDSFFDRFTGIVITTFQLDDGQQQAVWSEQQDYWHSCDCQRTVGPADEVWLMGTYNYQPLILTLEEGQLTLYHGENRVAQHEDVVSIEDEVKTWSFEAGSDNKMRLLDESDELIWAHYCDKRIDFNSNGVKYYWNVDWVKHETLMLCRDFRLYRHAETDTEAERIDVDCEIDYCSWGSSNALYTMWPTTGSFRKRW